MYNGKDESVALYRNNTPFEDLYHQNNVKVPPDLPR